MYYATVAAAHDRLQSLRLFPKMKEPWKRDLSVLWGIM